MIGLELLDNSAVALKVDDEGRVLARGEAASSADLRAAAVAALGRLSPAASHDLAVASFDPESEDSAAVMTALAATFPGLAERPAASGNAAAAAEAWVGAARGAANVVFFGVGDHAIAGIIRQGLPLTGPRGRAPAIAWLALNPVEREDYRKIGCLEAEVAALGIVRRLIWRIKAGDRSRVQDHVEGNLGAITVGHVLAAARSGDGVSISVMRDTAKYLGMAAANLVVIADPQVLVLGGVMASAADLLFEPVRGEIARRLPPAILEALTIVPAALGADAPAIGAVRLAAASIP